MSQSFIAILLATILCACTTPSKDPNKKEDIQKDNSPLLTKPVVRRIWIPDQILDGGKVFDQGHWRYLLEKETTWSK
jgi:hypothetical protein